ncbi:hypothetical protein CXB51_025547 [Gossypium anomalum]|uniref:Uncharacterized protein n=1 Tax=Gossypium anomalum TaxID=47600 RepID=A0A8J5YQZ9_9ROSI|nr:hypothetical protein CXB51_025547 [Gossypium anomalum]
MILPSRVLSPLVFFPISTHFTAPPEISFASTVLQLGSFHRLARVEPWDLTADLKSHLQTLYAPIIQDNACILCITAAAGTELADAYSPDTVIASSPKKEVHDPWAFYLHATLLRQAFAHCGKLSTAASRRSMLYIRLIVCLCQIIDKNLKVKSLYTFIHFEFNPPIFIFRNMVLYFWDLKIQFQLLPPLKFFH